MVHTVDRSNQEKDFENVFKPPKVSQVKEFCPYSFVVLLVTPSLARLVNSENGFIPGKILPWLFKGAKAGTVHMVSAVIDEIPYSSGSSSLRGSKSGSQGISIYSVPSRSEANRLRRILFSDLATETATASHRSGAITFATHKYAGSFDDYEYGTNYKVMLPLANTIFQNGKEFTLLGQIWKIETEENGLQQFSRLKSKDLLYKHIDLHPSEDHHNLQKMCYSNIVPLTPFRAVSGCMGNVVSTFASSTGGGTTPASEELEKGLPIFLKDTRPKHYEVWAQIVPRELWRPYKKRTYQRGDLGMDFTALGHRFHRILSGGGGWGHRRGLIALEPDSGFDATPENTDQEPELFDNPLPEVARARDRVRFVAVYTKNNIPADKNARRHKSVTINSTYTFGTIAQQQPAQNHNVPPSPLAKEDSNDKKACLTVRGSFGGQSLKGTSLWIDVDGPGIVSTNVVKTKLPPHMYFSYAKDNRLEARPHIIEKQEYPNLTDAKPRVVESPDWKHEPRRGQADFHGS